MTPPFDAIHKHDMSEIKSTISKGGGPLARRKADENYEDDDQGEPELRDTLFIRNLARFDTTQESLKEYIEKNFGETVYCLICKDKETGESKGTAFVKFRSAEAAEKCLGEYEDPEHQSKFFLDGRNLFVLPALTREKINEFKRVVAPGTDSEVGANKKKKPRHNRAPSLVTQKAVASNNSGTPKARPSHPKKFPINKSRNKKGARPFKKGPRDNGDNKPPGLKKLKNLKSKKKAPKKESAKKSRGRH